MDWDTMGELMLSVLIFAPGLIVFAVLLLIGLAMILERSGAFGVLASSTDGGPSEAAAAANPHSGKIVSSLKEAVQAEAAAEEEAAEDQAGR